MTKKARSDRDSTGKGKSAGAASSPAKSWLLQGVTLAVLLAAFALFFLVYAPSRSDYLVNRNFRLLGDMSRQISEAVVNVNAALTNASKILTISPSGTNSESAAICSSNAFANFCNRVAGIVPSVALNKGAFEPATNAVQTADLALKQRGQTESLVLTYANHPGWNNSNEVSTDSASNAFTAMVDLRELLRPILAKSDFADILISRTNGEVVFQLTQTENPATNSAAASELRITELPQFSEEARTNLAARGTCLLEKLRVAGSSYKLFAQPVRISVGGAGATLECWLCGLVRGRDFAAETWEVPSTTTIVFIFAAVGLLLLWPFLNIIFCGPVSDLRRWEVAWVLAASFFGCAILVLVLLYTNTWLAAEQRSDEDLEKLARQVQNNLVEELSQVDQLLTRFDQKLLERAKEYTNSENWSDVRTRTRVFDDPNMFAVAASYPDILDVFWVDDKGMMQVAKWTPQRNTTGLVPVGDRAYFQSINARWAWSWNVFANRAPSSTRSGPPLGGDLFYLDSVFSKTRSENEAAFARAFSVDLWPGPNEVKATNYFERPVASVVTLRPLSLFSPLLPAGYGFCLIDGTGQVLFHSDFRRNLRENFLTEAGEDHILSGAVYARTQGHADVRYYNKIHHASVSPVKGLPWSIVAFRDEQVLDRVHRNILLVAGTLLAIYVVALLLVLLPVLFVIRHRCGGWLQWLWIGSPPTASGWRCSRTWAFITERAVLGSLLVCFAMVPAYVCYRLAFSNEMAAYVKGTELKLARELEQRAVDDRTKSGKWASAADGSNYWQQRLRYRSANHMNLYLMFFGEMHKETNTVALGAANSVESTWLDDLYAACRPHFQETELRTMGLDLSHAKDNSWHSSATNGLTLTLWGAAGSGERKAIGLTSSVPNMTWLGLWPFKKFHPDMGWHLFWYFGLLGLICTPFAISGFIARRLLLSNLPPKLRSAPSSRHIKLAAPLLEPTSADIEGTTFAAIESTRIRVLRAPETLKNLMCLDRDTVVFVPKSLTEGDEITLRQSSYQTVLVACECSTASPEQFWLFSAVSLRKKAEELTGVSVVSVVSVCPWPLLACPGRVRGVSGAVAGWGGTPKNRRKSLSK